MSYASLDCPGSWRPVAHLAPGNGFLDDLVARKLATPMLCVAEGST